MAAVAVLGLGIAVAPAQAPAVGPPHDRETNTASGKALQEIGGGIFELGKIRLDKERRLIRFPAIVNMREGVLEYLLVTSYGKTHESLLRTDVQPQDIHVAMLLLGAQGAGTNALPEDPSQPLPGDKVTIELVWKNKSKEHRERAESFVRDIKRKTLMTKGDWVYNGSRLREDGFAAQSDGSIVSLITDPDALVNNPRLGRENDDNWMAKGGKLPAFNQPVEVIITLAKPAGSQR